MSSTGCDVRLVFDIGMHRGEDTAFYVSRGYRVVGVEANAALIEGLRERFRAEIDRGDVVVVPMAIGAEAGTARFAVARESTVFSTANADYLALGRRQDVDFDVVEVEMTTLPALVAAYGVPYYVKVDIEGMDHDVVASLADLPSRPPRLSLESTVTGAGATVAAVADELRLLRRLGYRRFKLVDQTRLRDLEGTVLTAEGDAVVYAYEKNASGPFGDEAPGSWHSAAGIAPRMFGHLARHQLLSSGGWVARTSLGARARAGVKRAGERVAPTVHLNRWFDLHART